MKWTLSLKVIAMAVGLLSAGSASAQFLYFDRPISETSYPSPFLRFWYGDNGAYSFYDEIGFPDYNNYTYVNGTRVDPNFVFYGGTQDGRLFGALRDDSYQQKAATVNSLGGIELIAGSTATSISGMSGQYTLRSDGMYKNDTKVHNFGGGFGTADVSGSGYMASMYEFGDFGGSLGGLRTPTGAYFTAESLIGDLGVDSFVHDLTNTDKLLYTQKFTTSFSAPFNELKTYDLISGDIFKVPDVPISPYQVSIGGTTVTYHPQILKATMNSRGEIAAIIKRRPDLERSEIWSYDPTDGWLNMSESNGLGDNYYLGSLGITEGGTIFASIVESTPSGQFGFNTYRGGVAMNRYDPVPEPGTMLLLAAGAGGLIAARRKRKA